MRLVAVGAARAARAAQPNCVGRGRRGVRALDANCCIDSGGETMLERRFLALVRQEPGCRAR